MKKNTLMSARRHCLTAVALLVLGTAASASAATALTGQLVLRPLTPGDKTVYKLPSTTEVSGGLNTVAVGTPVYLEAEVNSAIAPSNILSVTWVLTNRPITSIATLTNSPLGTNVPVYEPAERVIYQSAGRYLLRPDVEGQYTVVATIVTSGSGSTNVSATITAATYLGVATCAYCHSGSVSVQDKVHPWQKTAHASIFTEGIDGLLGSYSQSCLACHTVGYDTTASAVNGGFDDVAKQVNWTFPTVLTNGNWSSMAPTLQNVANIQCENCHGPGSQHARNLGDTNLITKSVNSGDCNQCHDAPTHHIKGTEWYTSGHALTTRVPSGPTRSACVRCHTSWGFIGQINGSTTTNTTFSAIGCQACHEPHGETMPTNNPHLLRVLGSYTMPDGTTVANAGEGALCLQCHHSRNGAATNNVVNYQKGLPTWNGGSSFGVHDSPQGDMVLGINAITYGQNIPSSAHRTSVTNLCVGCHMAPTVTTDAAFLKAGGHTFHMSYNVVTNGITNSVDRVDVCAQCHGAINSFDMPRGDYNGDGIIEGVQTEVQHLLDRLTTLLPNANGIIDGLVKTSVSTKTNWTTKQLNAAYNWQFVNADGSKGVHNAPYAVGLLKASIGDLTGDANSDGLPDSWQIQFFGSATAANAAPNASPAGDNIPNWLKYALGINPMIAGITNTTGQIVWANGTSLGGTTNTLQIFTAAEVAFDTEVGKTYYVQEVTSLSGGWVNVAGPIAGTGSSYSYVTTTRKNVQQFFRVYHNP